MLTRAHGGQAGMRLPFSGGPLEQPAALMEAFAMLDRLVDAKPD